VERVSDAIWELSMEATTVISSRQSRHSVSSNTLLRWEAAMTLTAVSPRSQASIGRPAATAAGPGAPVERSPPVFHRRKDDVLRIHWLLPVIVAEVEPSALPPFVR
jgi:hypothetical protein